MQLPNVGWLYWPLDYLALLSPSCPIWMSRRSSNCVAWSMKQSRAIAAGRDVSERSWEPKTDPKILQGQVSEEIRKVFVSLLGELFGISSHGMPSVFGPDVVGELVDDLRTRSENEESGSMLAWTQALDEFGASGGEVVFGFSASDAAAVQLSAYGETTSHRVVLGGRGGVNQPKGRFSWMG